MKTSESIKNISGAVFNFHKEVSKIPKTDTNPFFKSKYAALPAILDAIREPLQKAGLTIMQFPKDDCGLETIIIHPESGEWMSEVYYMKPVKDDPQGRGSLLTYQRRYAIGAILSLNIDEDDDGNKASEPIQEKAKPQTVKGGKPKLTPTSAAWSKAVDFLKQGNLIFDVLKKYEMTEEDKEQLMSEAL
jgi:hypothetical protein